ncbi:rust resistance kinase Lr10-like [Juglans regia]|uniref:Rust resistance kinase Lr10-like n=1 Tax=Juglans regia TaxID=51240 RepID=A0A6P9DX94_JUGRE|nr:rust resistance kinase Lr10-like [Juglans regia]
MVLIAARGITSIIPSGVMVIMIAALLLLLLPQTFCLKIFYCDTYSVTPSSCANHSIRFPFRLKGEATKCSGQTYELSCENNHELLFYSDLGGKYYVQQLNYDNRTIRLVDSGIQEDNYSFIPRFIINYSNLSRLQGRGLYYETGYGITYTAKGMDYESWYGTTIAKGVAIVNCKKPVKSNSTSYLYLETSSSTCSNNGSASSSNSSSLSISQYSKSYIYVKVGTTEAGDVEDSCKIERMFLTSWPGPNAADNINISCADLRNVFLSGFELQWFIPGFSRLDTIRLLLFIVYRHGAATVLGTPFVVAFLIYKWRRRHLSMYDAIEEFLQNHNNLMTIRYSFSEIKKMTKNFKEKLGEGGYGTVFKGTLRSGRHVAVKMLGKSKANGQEFTNEVATIGRIHHVNVVQLIGFCFHGSKRALVYEFMPHGSLNNYIFSLEGSILLSCEKTYNIALGVARGIEYLHRGCDMQILHFDIKPHNILLDENFTPKVSDFGLAKLYSKENNTISLTAARGTLGYMAPELFYKNIGGISYKADVYSFGMLLMEMVGKRKNINAFAEHSSQIYFPTWVYDQFRNGKDIEQMECVTEEEKEIVKKMIIVALWCIQMNPWNRPSMSKVVEMLEGDAEQLQIPPKAPLSSPERVIKDCEVHNSSQTWTSSTS